MVWQSWLNGQDSGLLFRRSGVQAPSLAPGFGKQLIMADSALGPQLSNKLENAKKKKNSTWPCCNVYVTNKGFFLLLILLWSDNLWLVHLLLVSPKEFQRIESRSSK